MVTKVFTSYEKQIELLKNRGILIDSDYDKQYATEILQKTGYYNLINGYKKPFIDINETNKLNHDCFKKGTTIQEIHALYEFDRVLREAFMNFVLKIEIHIKSLIAYYFSESYGHDNYLIYANFDTSKRDAHSQIPVLLSDIQRQISSHTNDPCISHYLNKYGYIPLWVLTNILTFGTISKFYSLMKIKEKTGVSRALNLQPHDLENFLMYLSSVRNFCAHGNRMFCYESKKRALNDTTYHQRLHLSLNNGVYANGKRDLFAALIAIKMLSSKNDYQRLKKQLIRNLKYLSKKLKVLSIDEVLACMGFPNNWTAL